MGKLSRAERTGLCLLAVILAALLGIIALRRQTPETGIEATPTVPVAAPVPDTIVPASQSEPSIRKEKKTTKKHSRKPAETPRRHLDDTF